MQERNCLQQAGTKVADSLKEKINARSLCTGCDMSHLFRIMLSSLGPLLNVPSQITSRGIVHYDVQFLRTRIHIPPLSLVARYACAIDLLAAG